MWAINQRIKERKSVSCGHFYGGRIEQLNDRKREREREDLSINLVVVMTALLSLLSLFPFSNSVSYCVVTPLHDIHQSKELEQRERERERENTLRTLSLTHPIVS